MFLVVDNFSLGLKDQKEDRVSSETGSSQGVTHERGFETHSMFSVKNKGIQSLKLKLSLYLFPSHD